MIGEYARAVYNSPTTAGVVSGATLIESFNQWLQVLPIKMPALSLVAGFVLSCVLIANHIKRFKVQTIEEHNKVIEGENAKLEQQKLKLEIAEIKRKSVSYA